MKKDGSAIISSIILLFLISLIGCMYYKMASYNIKIEALNYIHSDKYDISKEEEEVIYKFMKSINKMICDELNNEVESVTEEMLCNIELPSIDRCLMNYDAEKHKFNFIYHAKDGSEKYREINYKVDGNKIILIPLYISKK